MRLFPRWHTPEEVAKQLIEGLEQGTLALAPLTPDMTEMVEEALQLTAEVYATLGRLDPKYIAPKLPTAERRARLARQSSEAVLEALENLRDIRTQAKALEVEKAALTRRKVVWRSARVLFFAIPLAYFLYLLWTRPVTEFVGYVLAFVAGMAVSAWHLLPTRLRMADENTRLFSAVAELVTRAKAATEVRLG